MLIILPRHWRSFHKRFAEGCFDVLSLSLKWEEPLAVVMYDDKQMTEVEVKQWLQYNPPIIKDIAIAVPLESSFHELKRM